MTRTLRLPPASRFLLLAAALVALAVLVVGDSPPPAQASSHVLVRNTGQTDTGASYFTGAFSIAQAFTTGATSGGYALGSINIVVNATNITETQRDAIRAELWSSSSGAPGSKLYDLTVPDHPISTGTVSFAAPANTMLAASTTYYAVFYTVGNFNMDLDATSADGEDAGGATGWSIANTGRSVQVDVPTSSSTWAAGIGTSLFIAVNAPQTTHVVQFNRASAVVTETDEDVAREIGRMTVIPPTSPSSSFTVGLSISVNGADRQTSGTPFTFTCEPGKDFIRRTESVAVEPRTRALVFTPTICGDEVPEGEESFTFTLQPGTGYTVGANSSITVTIRDDDTPAAPADLLVRASDAKLDLDWTAPVGTLTGYDVHYTSATSASVADDAAVQTGGAAAGWVAHSRTATDLNAAHEITGLTNTTPYRVRVRARSYAGDGAWAQGSGTPGTPTQAQSPPEAPRYVSVYPSGDGSYLIVSWAAPDSDDPPVTGYDVQYRLSTATTWTDVPDDGISQGNTVLSGLTQGSTYDARVRAKNDIGNSAWRTGTGTLSSSDKDDLLSGLTLTAATSETGTFAGVKLLSIFRPNLIYYHAVVDDSYTHVKVTPTTREYRRLRDGERYVGEQRLPQQRHRVLRGGSPHPGHLRRRLRNKDVYAAFVPACKRPETQWRRHVGRKRGRA